MMLQTGNPGVRFQPRPIEGVTLTNPIEPDRLILDGQQRLTSLFQVFLTGKPVKTRNARGKEIHHWYYIDIAKALDPNPNVDREDVIVTVPEDKIIRNFRKEVLADYSTTEKECAAEVFPLHLVFDTPEQFNWMQRYLQLDPTNMQERLARWTSFVQEVIHSYENYQVPVISLRKETERVAVCQVFEKVNQGGISLTVFELVTATFAADKFDLREDWKKRKEQLEKHQVLTDIQNTDFLQAVTMLATLENPPVSCKRKDVLKLTLEEYKQWADSVTQGFEQAAKFLHTQKIFSNRDLPYQTQLTALAAIFAALGDRANNDGVSAKLMRWYWCGVFGELYGSAIESRLAKDLPEVLSWIDEDSEPDTIRDANFFSNRLLGLSSRRSAAYKGLSALLLRDGGCDFFTGYPIDTLIHFSEPIDIHHIFPQHWCKNNGIKAELYDCVVNKTPLSVKTNRKIGGKAPSVYLANIQKDANISEERMDEILRSHVINESAMRSDNFDLFFQSRKNALLNRIEKAMGKPILREAIEEADNF